MANLYLSFLGTNDYLEAIYHFNDQKKQTRFIQEATVGFLCQDWTDEDKIIIFNTADAKKNNWFDGGFANSSKGLKSCLEALSLKPTIHGIDIPTGATESEIWSIFNIVLNQIKENDVVVFDITHAFRSIPMLAIVILNYAKVIKKIHLSGIYYGAFETICPAPLVKEKPIEQRLAPVFNLTAFDELLSWSMALDRFMSTGDASATASLAKITSLPILKETKGQDKAAKATDNLAKKLEEFSQAIASCRGKKISATADQLKKSIAACLALDSINSALLPMLKDLDGRLSQFKNNPVSDGFHAVRWCIDHNLIQQGYTFLQESIITWIAAEFSLDYKVRDNRRIVSQALAISHKNFPENKWEKPACDHPDIVNKCLNIIRNKPSLADIYEQITQRRNDINHSGMVSNPVSFDHLKNKLDDFLRNIEKMM